MTTSEQIILVLRFSLGLMFGLSASSKLITPRSFFYGVAEYGLLPQRMVVISALAIIVCETFLAVSHVSRQFLVFSVPMALIILFVFFTAVGINLVRQRDIPCFCFGNDEGEFISARSLARLIVAIAGEFILLVNTRYHAASFERTVARPLTFDIVLAVTWSAFVIIMVSWGLSLPDLWRLGMRQVKLRRQFTPSTSSITKEAN